MKIIFAGTPQFAANALAALLAEHDIVAVLTQPDRPSGRGMQLTASPVKQLALQHGVTVLQPATLKTEEAQREIAALDANVMVVAAYGLILPQAVLSLPRLGCLNIHASLFMAYFNFLARHTRLSVLERIIKAYRLYVEQTKRCGMESVLSLTRAWTMVRFFDAGMLQTTRCKCCGGDFVAHAHDPKRDYVCGLCHMPARAGKTRRAAEAAAAIAAGAAV